MDSSLQNSLDTNASLQDLSVEDLQKQLKQLQQTSVQYQNNLNEYIVKNNEMKKIQQKYQITHALKNKQLALEKQFLSLSDELKCKQIRIDKNQIKNLGIQSKNNDLEIKEIIYQTYIEYTEIQKQHQDKEYILQQQEQSLLKQELELEQYQKQKDNNQKQLNEFQVQKFKNNNIKNQRENLSKSLEIISNQKINEIKTLTQSYKQNKVEVQQYTNLKNKLGKLTLQVIDNVIQNTQTLHNQEVITLKQYQSHFNNTDELFKQNKIKSQIFLNECDVNMENLNIQNLYVDQLADADQDQLTEELDYLKTQNEQQKQLLSDLKYSYNLGEQILSYEEENLNQVKQQIKYKKMKQKELVAQYNKEKDG